MALDKYALSATGQEIVQGAFGVEDAPEHVFAFFREIANLPDLASDLAGEKDSPERAPKAKDLVDTRDNGRTLDLEAHQRLKALKERLQQRLAGHVHSYQARWDGARLSTGHIGWLAGSAGDGSEPGEDRSPGSGLCLDVWLRLSEVIRVQLAELQQVDPLEQEISAHARFGEERARFFTGRAEPLAGSAPTACGQPQPPADLG